MNRDQKIIERLGGTVAVSEIFSIRPGAVSMWKKNGIPPARMMYIELAFPQVVPKKPGRKAA